MTIYRSSILTIFSFLAVPAGYQYLHDINWLIPESETWFTLTNSEYVVKLEVLLDAHFQQTTSYSTADAPCPPYVLLARCYV